MVVDFYYLFTISVGELGNGRPDGTPTRPRRQLNLPVSMTPQQKNHDGGEIENKLQEIMKMNGIINISGKV